MWYKNDSDVETIRFRACMEHNKHHYHSATEQTEADHPEKRTPLNSASTSTVNLPCYVLGCGSLMPARRLALQNIIRNPRQKGQHRLGTIGVAELITELLVRIDFTFDCFCHDKL